MNKELLKATMRKYKKASKVDYAITNPDGLGDCQSCVNYALSEKYGEESKGVWVKHFTRGMNASGSIENQESVYIAHDITEEQANVLVEVFSEAFKVFPKEYDPCKCFEIYDKNAEIYSVTYYDKELNRTYKTIYGSYKSARSYEKHLRTHPFCKEVTNIRMEREF
jgi:hypothetical protein